MIEKIKIVLTNLKNANAAFSLFLYVVIGQIFAGLFWYWNVSEMGTVWFLTLACANISGFLIGYQDKDGNKLWNEEFHLPEKLYDR